MAHTTTRAFIDDELLEGSGLGRSGVETLADALEAQRGSFKLTLRRGGSRPGPGTYGYVGAEVVLDKCEYAAPKEVFDFSEDVKSLSESAFVRPFKFDGFCLGNRRLTEHIDKVR